MKTKISLAVFGLLNLVSSSAFAYYSLIDNGSILKPGQYQASVEPQWSSVGYNTIFRADTNVTDDSDARAMFGFGTVDFQFGGSYKWIPFPDTAHQPAMGGSVGGIFARRNDGTTETTLLLSPLASKTFETEIGDVSPYVSLPFGVTWTANDTVMPAQLVGGAQFEPLNWKQFSFFAELGVNLHESYGHASVALMYRFDDVDDVGGKKPAHR